MTRYRILERDFRFLYPYIAQKKYWFWPFWISIGWPKTSRAEAETLVIRDRKYGNSDVLKECHEYDEIVGTGG